MAANTLLVKNMVCQRCILSVEGVLKKLDIPYSKVLFGEIYLTDKISAQQKQNLLTELNRIGLEIIDNHTTVLIEKIKQLVIKMARNEESEKEKKINLSKYLSNQLNYEYTHLSSLFSSVEGRTIEQYFIEQRIEKAKELIVYRQLTLSEIAYQLNFSSVAHLSSQFKKVTGLTPSYYKEIGTAKRKALDKV